MINIMEGQSIYKLQFISLREVTLGGNDMNQVHYFFFVDRIHRIPKINIAPEHRPFQKVSTLPSSIFLVGYAFRESTC